MAGINKIGGGLYDPGYIAPTQSTEVKTDEASLGNDPKKLKPKAGGKKPDKSDGEKQPDYTPTYETEPKVKGPYDDWDDDQIEKQIQMLEKSGWNDRSYENNKQYQDLTNLAAQRHPEDAQKRTRAVGANHASLLHNVMNYTNNYQNTSELAKSRDKAMKDLKGQEGKGRPLFTPTMSLIAGEYGDARFATSGSDKRYHVLDSRTGKSIGTTSKTNLNDWNKNWETYLKENGLKLSEPDENGHVNLVDSNGWIADTFDSKEEAENFMKNPYKLGELAEEKHYVRYPGGRKQYFDSKEEAKAERKAENAARHPERMKAIGQWLTMLGQGAAAMIGNNILMNAGQAPSIKTLMGQELQNRLEGNNKLYYKNEEAKSDSVRKLMELADAGMIDLNNLTNEQMAMFQSAVGKKNADMIMDKIYNQQLEREAAMDFDNWPTEIKEKYGKWKATVPSSAVVDNRFMALLSGDTSVRKLGNLWNTKTKLELGKDKATLDHLEKVVEAARIQNHMSQAQADVIKELVAEQLKAAKLSNARAKQEMATATVDAIAGAVSKFVK